MPNIKSAKKRMELSRQANVTNRARRSTLRTTLRRVRETQDADEGRELLQNAFSMLDKAAQDRLVHPNKAARLKGQLARHVESLSS